MSQHIVFIPGLWIHSSAWRPWLKLVADQGHTAEAIGWPGERSTVATTRSNPGDLAGYGVSEVTDHYAALVASMPQPPVVVGHSFGGLVAQKLLAAGLVSAAVAIDPAPIKGVAALPFAQIRSALPVLARKRNRDAAVMLTRRQFRYGFGNALTRAESDELYQRFAIPGPGRPVFDLTAAKKDPNSPTAVSYDDANRGPLLIVGGQRDHTIPEKVSRQAAELYRPGSNTEYRRIDGRGHSLVLDHGWRDVAAPVLDWLRSTADTDRTRLG